MNIGIDFSTFESHDQAYADSWSMFPAGFAPDRSAVEPPPISMQRPNPAFGLYYDNKTSEYKMRDPLVVSESGEVMCSVPNTYEPGKTYYCEIVRKDGSYSAKVTADPSENPSPPEKLVWRVRLFVVPTSSAEPSYQFHTGAITVSASSPCRVDSIDDATYSVPTGMEDTGQVITVNYTKVGDDCKDGTNSFTIPILRSSGGGGGGFSMDVTDEAVTGTTDHPNGGVKVTLSPSAGQGTNFTVWNGKDGENGNDGSPGAPGKDGNDAVVNVTQTANGATDVHKNGGTKVTLTPNNGGAAATFDVWNGNDGSPGAPGRTGDDGRSVSSVNAGEPVSQDGFTKTPVTFFDNAGNAIGTVDVAAKDGGAGQDQPFTIDMSLVIRYDLSTRQIQARDVTVKNGVVSYGNTWKMITGGQAAAHNSDFN